jgi:hypothetical protein
VEQPHRQYELDRRREVLQQAQRGHRHAPGTGGEQQQRHRGQRAGKEQPGPGADPRALQRAAMQAEPRQRRHRHRREQRGLQRQSFERAQRCGLAQQPVQAEAEGQRQRDPRRHARRPGEPADAGCGHRQRPALQRPQPLVQHHHAERHVDQRVE